MTDEYLFISDCHLDRSRPEISKNLIEFLVNRVSAARYLYILGDLFEVWPGDDDPALGLRDIIATLQIFISSLEIVIFWSVMRWQSRPDSKLLPSPQT
jgi:UDP-2,3-diacylglucosamine pyrophosphatase LpxH